MSLRVEITKRFRRPRGRARPRVAGGPCVPFWNLLLLQVAASLRSWFEFLSVKTVLNTEFEAPPRMVGRIHGPLRRHTIPNTINRPQPAHERTQAHVFMRHRFTSALIMRTPNPGGRLSAVVRCGLAKGITASPEPYTECIASHAHPPLRTPDERDERRAHCAALRAPHAPLVKVVHGGAHSASMVSLVSASGTAGSTKVSASGAVGWHAALRQTPFLMSPHAAQRTIFAIAHGCSAHAHASPGARGPSCAVCRHHASSRPTVLLRRS